MNLYLLLLLNVFMLVCAFELTRVREFFTLIVLLAIFSGFLALTFALLGAVDVAFTEAVVGTSIATVFFMMLVQRIEIGELVPEGNLRGVLAAGVAVGVGLALAWGTHALPAFGDPESAMHTHVAAQYVTRHIEEMATPNVVTAVLADYRGFDTLIETAVVFAAAVICLLVLGGAERRQGGRA